MWSFTGGLAMGISFGGLRTLLRSRRVWWGRGLHSVLKSDLASTLAPSLTSCVTSCG